MEEKDKQPGRASKYLDTFFPDKSSKSKQPTVSIPDKNELGTSQSKVEALPVKSHISKGNESKAHSSEPKPVAERSNVPRAEVPIFSDDIWGNDFPEDFSEDVVVVDTVLPEKQVFVPSKPKESQQLDRPITINLVDDSDVPVILSSCSSNKPNLNIRGVDKVPAIPIINLDSSLSQSSKIPIIPISQSSKSGPSTSSKALTTDWLRNQLDKVNKECCSLKNAFIAKDGESSILRDKLRNAELETQKVKQNLLNASSKEKNKFEEQIKDLEKQLNNARTQILFKSKEAESNLERYLELKNLNVKTPEFPHVRTPSCSFNVFQTRSEHLKQDASTQSCSFDPTMGDPAAKNETEIFKKTVDIEAIKLDARIHVGKELEFFIHPDLFNESDSEFNFVIPPSTDYFPFNVMYKDISEMPSDDFSCEPLKLYNIWKVKRENLGEIMMDVLNISSDSDTDTNFKSLPQKKDTLQSPTKNSPINLQSSINRQDPLSGPSEPLLELNKTSNHKDIIEAGKDCENKETEKTPLITKVKDHPRLLFLGNSRYFTSLKGIHQLLIEMCSSASWKRIALEKIINHITDMTKELYVAMCDPTVVSYYSSVNLRDNQIIESCSDVSELNLDYNVFSPEKWKGKEIYVDLRRGIALIKVLCEIDPGCMELILNTCVEKPSLKPHIKSTKKIGRVKVPKKKKKFCCIISKQNLTSNVINSQSVKTSQNQSSISNQEMSNNEFKQCPKETQPAAVIQEQFPRETQPAVIIQGESSKESQPVITMHDQPTKVVEEPSLIIGEQSTSKIKQPTLVIKEREQLAAKRALQKLTKKKITCLNNLKNLPIKQKCHKCNFVKQPMDSAPKEGKHSRGNAYYIKPCEQFSWDFKEGSIESNPLLKENRMDVDKKEDKDKNIPLLYDDTFFEKKKPVGNILEQIAHEALMDDKKNIDNPVSINPNEPLDNSQANILKPSDCDNKEPNDIRENFDKDIHKEIIESIKLLEENKCDEESSSMALEEIEDAPQFSVMENIVKNERLPWVEAINSNLLPLDKNPTTKDIMALREDACCSEAEKEFLTGALATFNKIKLNMMDGADPEEDKGKKRKYVQEDLGSTKKLALNLQNLEETKLAEDANFIMEVEEKLPSDNLKSTSGSFSLKKKRDVRPLRKSLKEGVPGTSKEEPNLDKEIEMEIQKIFTKCTDMKQNDKSEEKLKQIDSFNCDDLYKSERFYYFNHLAHSGGFLVLIFEIIRDIGRKRYTLNFNYLFAVIINLVHTLLKNGNTGLIRRHHLFDILQEILYCRPSPVALLQMNKLLVDVIPCQPFFTSLMCHNASSSHMVIDSESVYFTRGACFIEVISSLIDNYMDNTDWEIQTYCVRWLSHMYLIEKTIIEEWYFTQKTICRRCQCIALLTNMAVKIFESASSYYLECSIENKLTYALSGKLLEIMQNGVQILYNMIDFDKYFAENIGDRYGMFLRFLDTLKLIHRNPEQFKEFNLNSIDLNTLQLLLIEEKVVSNIAKTSSNFDTMNEAGNLFNAETVWPPKSFDKDKLSLSDTEEFSD